MVVVMGSVAEMAGAEAGKPLRGLAVARRRVRCL